MPKEVNSSESTTYFGLLAQATSPSARSDTKTYFKKRQLMMNPPINPLGRILGLRSEFARLRRFRGKARLYTFARFCSEARI